MLVSIWLLRVVARGVTRKALVALAVVVVALAVTGLTLELRAVGVPVRLTFPFPQALTL